MRIEDGTPCLQNPVCSKRDGLQGAAAVRSDTRNLARASLGGALRAELVTARRIPAGRALRATLKCMSVTVSHPISINRTYSTREDWSINHHVVWQDEEDRVGRQRPSADRLRGSRRAPGNHTPQRCRLALLDLGNRRSGRPAAGLSRRVRAAGLRCAVGHRRGGGRSSDPGGEAAQANGLPA
jgi:hypothetical protein